ncbi:MAG: hypothetical protein DWQ31_03640 [Planctomycetota bacterium]|nr:MAG: hypothetical protein DWQ31_03640 [Planctomycetota bacterium]
MSEAGSDLEVIVETGARLHFGLLAFGQRHGRQFGGVGAMIDGVGFRLAVSPAESLQVVDRSETGSWSPRIESTVARYVAAESLTAPPPCRIEVIAAPRPHTGLGSGTQLGLAVAAALDRYRGCPVRDIEELAAVSGRGQRSAVGAHGFVQGGLLFEEGKLPGEMLSPLAERVALPDEWRFVLFSRDAVEGQSGTAEQESFARLPPISGEVTARLRSEIVESMLPAARQGDRAAFGESLDRYGSTAGACFAAAQGGVYASAESARLVERLRTAGVVGVGQSSWGPTIFALAANAGEAETIVELVEREAAQDTTLAAWRTSLVSVRNHGALIESREATTLKTTS